MMGVRIRVEEGEPIDKALRRFKKRLFREGVYWEMQKRSYYVDSTQLRRRQRFRRRFKAREAILIDQITGKVPCDSLEKAKAAFWKRTGKP